MNTPKIDAFSQALNDLGDWKRPSIPPEEKEARGHIAREIRRKEEAVPEALRGIPVAEIVRICQVEASTARRWKRGAIKPPETALMALRIRFHGELDDLGPEWKKWRYRDGELRSPDGWRINRNDALSVPLMHGQISALRGKIADLEEQIEDRGLGMEEQPLPTEWEVEIA